MLFPIHRPRNPYCRIHRPPGCMLPPDSAAYSVSPLSPVANPSSKPPALGKGTLLPETETSRTAGQIAELMHFHNCPETRRVNRKIGLSKNPRMGFQRKRTLNWWSEIASRRARLIDRPQSTSNINLRITYYYSIFTYAHAYPLAPKANSPSVIEGKLGVDENEIFEMHVDDLKHVTPIF